MDSRIVKDEDQVICLICLATIKNRKELCSGDCING